MMDDYTRKGRFKRAQVIRQDIQEDDQQPVQQNARQLARVPTIAIDELAGNWIKEVREAGGGMTLGPKDGVVAMPENTEGQAQPENGGFIRDMLGGEPEPEEEEVAEAVENVERAVREFVRGIVRRFGRNHD